MATIHDVIAEWGFHDALAELGLDADSDDWFARGLRAQAARTLRARRPAGVPGEGPVRIALMRRDGLMGTRGESPCPICGEPLRTDRAGERMKLSVDHITALIRGGAHHFDNLQIVHARCNSAKRDRAVPALTA